MHRAAAGLLVAMARSSGTASEPETAVMQQGEETQAVSMQPESLQAQVAELANMQDAMYVS